MKILLSNNAGKQLKKLNSRIQHKIIFTLEKFKENKPVDIIKMKHTKDEFRIRTGNYRIQLQKVEEGFLITKIGKRENFYLVYL